MLVAVFLGLAETNHNKRKDATNPKRLFYYYNLLWKDPVFVYYLVLLGCCMGIVYACLSEAPALVSLVLHLETHVIAVVSMGVMLGYIAGSIACAYLARRWKPNRILALGVGIVLAFSLLMGAFVTMGFVTLTSVLAPIIVIFSGIAIITPMAVSQALLPLAGVAGTASSLLGFAQMFFAALGTVFISVTRTGNAFAMPVTFTCFALLALVVFLVFIRPSDPKARLII